MIDLSMLHIVEETICVWLAIGVYLKTDNFYCSHHLKINEIYWLRAWAIFAIGGTFAHIVTAMVMKEYAATVVPLTYLPVQVLDSVFAYFCIFPPKVNNGKRKYLLFAGAGLALMAGGLVVLFADSISALSPRGRPQELVQILPAIWVLSRMTMPKWSTRRTIGKFMVFSTGATLAGGMVMMFSGATTLFDAHFFLAHHFKVLSYLIIFIGSCELIRKMKVRGG